VNVVALQPGHVSAIARLHAEALAGDFLPSLGPSFLTTLYRSMLELNLGFGFVARGTADDVAGFVMATEDSRSLFRQLITRRFFRLTWQVGVALVHHPRLVVRAVETFLYPSKEGTDTPAAELLVIVVRARDRSKGIGVALVDCLDQSMRQRRIAQYKVTVLAANEAAQKFYRRLGFALAGHFVMYGRPWNLFVREPS
jgi:ribosomal protein S18 acetylase RimI-like enzyme